MVLILKIVWVHGHAHACVLLSQLEFSPKVENSVLFYYV